MTHFLLSTRAVNWQLCIDSGVEIIALILLWPTVSSHLITENALHGNGVRVLQILSEDEQFQRYLLECRKDLSDNSSDYKRADKLICNTNPHLLTTFYFGGAGDN